MTLSLALSPCPNDTFIFDALVNNKIDTQGLHFEPLLADVETLNQNAIAGLPIISKISYGVLPLVAKQYVLLDAGSALGSGVGPLLIHRNEKPAIGSSSAMEIPSETVAIPGKYTTAHLLFTLAYPEWKEKIFLPYDQIEDYVSSGKGPGVIIHENRFTYAGKGLKLWQDLGEFWELKTNGPIPLGGIIIRRDMEYQLQKKVELLIRESIAYAYTQYPLLNDYIRFHAREMDETVMRKHIELYVNAYSMSLGEVGKSAVLQLMKQFSTVHHSEAVNESVFLS